MKRLSLAVLAVLMLISTGWAGASPVVNSADHNNLVIGANQEPDNLNPWEGSADTKENALALMDIGFSYFDSNGKIQPGLATEIPTEANGRVRINKDSSGNFVSQEVDWTIRTDAKWSDGVDITTDDVTFTYTVQQNQFIPASFRTFSDTVKEIKVKDPKSFTIVYNQPNLFYASPTGRLGLARFYDVAPKHVWESVFNSAVAAAQADQGNAASIISAQFLGADPAGAKATSVVGSGAFKLVEWQRGQFMRLARRGDFFIAPPGGDASKYVQEVVVQYFVAQETLQANVLNGAVDATDDIGLAGVNPSQLQTSLGNAGTVEVSPSGFIEQLNFNSYTKRGLGLPECQIADDLQLGDPRTRQAIIQAIDRATLAPVVFPGGVPSNSFVVKGDTGYNPNLNTYEFNQDAAKTILAQLGWADSDGNGILDRLTTDGRRVEFRLPHVTTTAGFRKNTQAFLQQDLKGVGIALEPTNEPAAILFSTNYVNGSNCNWQGIIEFASAGGIGEAPADELSGGLWADDPSTPAAYDNLARASNNFSGGNVIGWINSDFDKLRVQALATFDLDARAAVISKMQDIFSAELPFIPLYERTDIISAKTGLANYVKGNPLTRTPFWNAWEWGWTANGAQSVR
ncbi:peptide ABC transporter substrate-binding protein [Candidatus Acetothermia bacterium]|nr:peptide ABC transporter substrate-binding protein [Candidatus Acetothermia bacterium]MBI3643312.1 peptide ABC transporter substrate-binding protein [Candidatus Acetothermia bacterium]